jgi:hypothetical protein
VRLPRQHDVLHPTLLGRAFIGPRGEPAIGDGQVRRVTEQRDMPIQCRRPEGAVRLVALTDLIVGDELRLGLLDLDELTELRRLPRFALANDFRVRLKPGSRLGGC